MYSLMRRIFVKIASILLYLILLVLLPFLFILRVIFSFFINETHDGFKKDIRQFMKEVYVDLFKYILK